MDKTATLQALNEQTALEFKECSKSGQLVAVSIDTATDYWLDPVNGGKFWLTKVSHYGNYEIRNLVPSLQVLISYLHKAEGRPVCAFGV